MKSAIQNNLKKAERVGELNVIKYKYKELMIEMKRNKGNTTRQETCNYYFFFRKFRWPVRKKLQHLSTIAFHNLIITNQPHQVSNNVLQLGLNFDTKNKQPVSNILPTIT